MQEKSGIWDKIMHFLGFWLSFREEYRPAWHAGAMDDEEDLSKPKKVIE